MLTNVFHRLRGPVFELFDFIAGKTEFASVVVAFFAAFVVIFVVFPIHECAHALMAKALGDDTAERQGRLTLNPFAHIDLRGAILICFCNIGWAKPTPVDIRNCRKVSMRTANALVAFAGPLANVLMAYLFMIIFKLIAMNAEFSETTYYIVMAVAQVIQINLYLGVFNLVPIPPFDGYHILASFLPPKALIWFERNQQIIYWIFFIFLLMGYASIPLSYASSALMWVLDKMSFFLGTIF